MKSMTFKHWDLDKLDETFQLKQVWQSDVLDQWENNQQTVDDFEKKSILNIQASLIRGGRAWNETELENKFISPLIMIADIDDEQMGYFLERPLSVVINDIELSGIVDGMIATGIRNPQVPYFCLHEYKRSIEHQGTPDGQVLAAMLATRALNPNHRPVYGLFVVGLIWNFIILDKNNYCISREYVASNEDVFAIFKMLKELKRLVQIELIEYSNK